MSGRAGNDRVLNKPIILSLRSFCKPRLATGAACLMGAAPPASVKRGTMMHAYSLSSQEAGAIATRVRLLRRQRLLTAHQAALADVMLWSARRPGSGLLTASMAVLARLAGQARSTAIEGVAALERLGLIQRIRRRIRIAWIAGATASRQVANSYVLRPVNTGSDSRSARDQTSRIYTMEPPIAAVRDAQAALAERRRAIKARLHRDIKLD